MQGSQDENSHEISVQFYDLKSIIALKAGTEGLRRLKMGLFNLSLVTQCYIDTLQIG